MLKWRSAPESAPAKVALGIIGRPRRSEAVRLVLRDTALFELEPEDILEFDIPV